MLAEYWHSISRALLEELQQQTLLSFFLILFIDPVDSSSSLMRCFMLGPTICLVAFDLER